MGKKPSNFILSANLVFAAGILTSCDPSPTGGNANKAKGAFSVEATQINRGGPFGLAAGMPMSELKIVKDEGEGSYEIAPPMTHADFDYYGVTAYPDTGVCSVLASSHDIPAGSNGSPVRSKIDEIAGAMALKYGAGTPIDICTGGEVSCMDQFWTMTLLQKDRSYGYKWDKPTVPMKRARVREIYVLASGVDINTGNVLVGYRFDNYPKCEANAQKASANPL